jgi:hypothetical protein
MRSDLSVFRINRSCKPANPAFTMSENIREPGDRIGDLRFEIMISVVTGNLTAIISELVEPIGIEPTTSSLQSSRSPN